MTLNVLNHCRSQQAEKEESIILGVIFRRLYQNMQDFFNSLDTLLTSISHEDKIRIFKSENGYLVSLTRIQKRIVDPQRRRILSILSKTGYFGYVIRCVYYYYGRKNFWMPRYPINDWVASCSQSMQRPKSLQLKS